MRKRRTPRTTILAFILIVSMLPSLTAQAQNLTNVLKPVEIGFDAVIIRPLQLTTLVVGSVLLCPALLLSVPNGETARSEAIELFWTIPYENLVERELGDF